VPAPQSHTSGSVTNLIGQLQEGQGDAASELCSRYFEQLVALARNGLGGCRAGAADEEDAALSVLDTLVRGATGGRFPNLKDRRDLWSLLLVITNQKVIDLRRRENAQKRGGGQLLSLSAIEGDLAELCSSEPTAEFLAVLKEEHARLMTALRDDGLRQVATLTLEGYTPVEIASRLSVSVRTAQRKLKLIEQVWWELQKHG
jgi:DNA-directed RNA polymerase specialized sigma24 family protein